MAAFSSRGPLVAGGGDLLKPDVGAPGVDVLAAVAPPGNRGREFDLFSGTSMSSSAHGRPRRAAQAAAPGLVADGDQVGADDDGLRRARTSRHGRVGRVGSESVRAGRRSRHRRTRRPIRASCTTATSATGSRSSAARRPASIRRTATRYRLGYSYDRSDMNLASIAIGDLAGTQTVTRRVTNVSDKAATYTLLRRRCTGVDAAVGLDAHGRSRARRRRSRSRSPGRPRRSTATRPGYLTWTDRDHIVRMPVVIRPVAIGGPAEVTSNGSPVSWQVKIGYTARSRAIVARPGSGDGDVHARAGSGSRRSTRRSDRDVQVRRHRPRRRDLPRRDLRGRDHAGGHRSRPLRLPRRRARRRQRGRRLERGGHARRTPARPATYTRLRARLRHERARRRRGSCSRWVVGSVDAGNTTISGVGPATVGTQTHTATFSGPRACDAVPRPGRLQRRDGLARRGRS